jgi:hypothetical protein
VADGDESDSTPSINRLEIRMLHGEEEKVVLGDTPMRELINYGIKSLFVVVIN